MSNDFEHEYTNKAVCPWCGYIFQDLDDFGFDENFEIECYECGKDLFIATHIRIRYSTSKIEDG